MKALVVASIYLVVFSACQHENAVVNDQSNWPCGAVENLDSVTLQHRLIGEWQMVRQSAPTGQVTIPKDTILVKFSPPSGYTVTKNGALVSEGNFTLVADAHSTIDNKPVAMWHLNQSIASEYLAGYVFVCNTELAFVASFYDGMDQHYVKK